MENNLTPEIRFPGYIGDWEERKIGEFLTESRISGTNGLEAKKLTVKLWGKGVVPKDEIYQGSEATKYYIRKAGQFIYGKLDFLHQAFGIIPDKLVGYESTLDSPAFDIADNLNSSFFLEYVSRKQFYLYQGTIANGSRKAKRIHSETFFEMPLIAPTMEEQKKIGDFFKKVDQAIALHQQELTTLKQTKQGFLQKMFPKEGETLPEIRFPGFTGDWEQLKFENMLDENEGIRRGPFGSALKKEYFVNESDYVVYEQQNAIYNNYETRYNITKEKFDELKKFKLEEGDFIMSGAGTIGRISRVPKGIKQGVFNQALIRFKIDTSLTDSEYFLQLIRSENMQRKLTGANPGSAITNLVPMSEVKKWDVVVPSLKEQTKIGNFFKQLDETITLHLRELDALKETKKAFLQKMFA
ncbi:restriction endonuclease subunit S [Bacillus cereus]|nr:restriction endonuclease subunit S [Bacillus cereus]